MLKEAQLGSSAKLMIRAGVGGLVYASYAQNDWSLISPGSLIINFAEEPQLGGEMDLLLVIALGKRSIHSANRRLLPSGVLVSPACYGAAL